MTLSGPPWFYKYGARVLYQVIKINSATEINSLSHYIIAVMTLTMDLPQSEKPIHSDDKWWWSLYHIAPVFAKWQNDQASLSVGWADPAAQQGHRGECHTHKGAENTRLLQEADDRQVLDVTECFPEKENLPPKLHPPSGYTRSLGFDQRLWPNFTWLYFSVPTGCFQISRVWVTLVKDLLYFILARISEPSAQF